MPAMTSFRVTHSPQGKSLASQQTFPPLSQNPGGFGVNVFAINFLQSPQPCSFDVLSLHLDQALTLPSSFSANSGTPPLLQ